MLINHRQNALELNVITTLFLNVGYINTKL